MIDPKELIEECKSNLRDNTTQKQQYKTYIRKLITALERALNLGVVRSSSFEKHDCISNREVMQYLPQYGMTINGHDALLGDGYKVKCKICGREWFQNYP